MLFFLSDKRLHGFEEIEHLIQKYSNFHFNICPAKQLQKKYMMCLK